MAKVTIEQLAREAGVSVATVDRILNGRGRVREETAQKVQLAARRLDYHGVNALNSRLGADRPEVRLGVILQKERHAFYQNFAHQLELTMATCTTHRVRLTVKFAESSVPGELARLLRGMIGKVDIVAATGLDHHEVTRAVQELRSAGTPTISLLSDFAQGIRESYLGLNNLKVGRAVGWLMSKITSRPGKVGIFIGGARFHGHELRETGFRSSLREYAPHLELLNPLTNLETRQFTYESTVQLLDEHSDLAGIYCAGGGMEGAIAALRELREPGAVALMVNELTEESRHALQDRTVSLVMATPLRALCEELLAMIIHVREAGMAETPGQRFLNFEIWTPESL